ncbi:hypothetical protein D3C78_1698100 [compost metagenome]
MPSRIGRPISRPTVWLRLSVWVNHTTRGSGPLATTLKFLAAWTISPMSGLGERNFSAVDRSLNSMLTSASAAVPARDDTLPPRISRKQPMLPSCSPI